MSRFRFTLGQKDDAESGMGAVLQEPSLTGSECGGGGERVWGVGGARRPFLWISVTATLGDGLLEQSSMKQLSS